MDNTYNYFDPTDINHSIISKSCTNCNNKEFELFREGDFTDMVYVEICKVCNTKHRDNGYNLHKTR